MERIELKVVMLIEPGAHEIEEPHVYLGVSVETIARRVGLSRSVLQRRFQALLKRTVHEEILGARIKCAQQLLLKSKLPLATIAVRAGFKHQEYMGAVLKARTGMTPREWRNERRRLPR